MITLTDAALNKLTEFMDNAAAPGVRVMVKPGGCAGFAYGLELGIYEPGDHIIQQDGVEIYVDPFSAQYLNGTVIDWNEDIMGAGFSFNNPNAVGGCGCGSSFGV